MNANPKRGNEYKRTVSENELESEGNNLYVIYGGQGQTFKNVMKYL